MVEIPLSATPSQITKTVLSGQNVQLAIYQKSQGLFVDVNVDGVDFVVAVVARDLVPMVCREYMGFIGNLLFVDNLGNTDPEYSGLGNRHSLIYLTEEEYALIRE